MQEFDARTELSPHAGGRRALQRAIAAELGKLLAGTWPQEAIAVLDLACGDAAEVLPALASACVSSYTGVDSAAPALERARRNLQPLRCAVKLLKSNYSTLLDALSGPYELIHNRGSLRPLSRSAQAGYFRQCRRLLAPGGAHVLSTENPEADRGLRALAEAAGFDGWRTLFRTSSYGLFVCRVVVR